MRVCILLFTPHHLIPRFKDCFMTVSSQPRFLIVLTALFAALSAAAQTGPASQLRIQDDYLPTAVVGRGYSYILQGVGGQPPYTYAIVLGGLPQGLSLAADKISGTPAAPGAFFPTVRITDSKAATALKVLSLQSLHLEAHDTWCPVSQLGGGFSCVGMFDNFSGKGLAVAGSGAGGIFTTKNGGTTWGAEKDFGSQPVADVATSWCASSKDFWAVTLPSGASPGEIYHDVLGGGALTNEGRLPATWTGLRRRIEQSNSNCGGPMLASDSVGGMLFKDAAAGSWQPANTNLPANATGGVDVMDFDYGYPGNKNFAAVMTLDPGKTFDLYSSTSPAGGWTRCASITSTLSQQWRALAIMPDGLIIIGNAFGATKSVATCPGGALATGPGFKDNGQAITPIINGFAPSPCYGAARREVYAYTSQGIFFTPDFNTTVFDRFDRGLLSERVSDLGLASSCGDARLIAATADHGLAAGTDAGLCQGQTGNDRPVDVNGLAADFRFTSANRFMCTAGVPPAGLYLSSPAAGAFRDGAHGTEFFATGETRERDLAAVTTAPRASGATYLYAASQSGVYRSTNLGVSFPAFYPTNEPLNAIAGVPILPLLNTDAAAYGVSDTSVYASISPTTAWSPVAVFPAGNGAAGLDISPGGPLTGTVNDDEMWISAGPGGLFELQYIGGAFTLFSQQGGGARSADVRRAAAQQRRNSGNYVFIQTLLATGGGYRFLRGQKDNSPSSTINFVTAGSGLPADEEASQIVAEPNATTAGAVWVLFPTHGLYLSTDSGLTFTASAATGLPAGYNPLKLTLSKDFSSSSGLADVALLVAGHGVYQSIDGGKTYCSGPAPVNQAPSSPRALASSTIDNARLFMASDYGAFYSEDGGATFHSRFVNASPVNALLFHPGDDALLLGNATGVYRSPDYGLTWNLVSSTGNITDFSLNIDNPLVISATRSAASDLLTGDGGLTWTVQGSATDGMAVDYNSSTTLAGLTRKTGPAMPAGATAAYWMIGSSSGAAWSANGSTWTAANGTNPDYLLSAVGGNWGSVTTLGSTPSHVLAGNNIYGLYRTLDGGDDWKKVSGAGSGLEATSQIASALITSTTSFGNTDALVGMTGAAAGGVYLSGNGGENWTQINSGFDPNSLSISTLVKTSCAGCPVQYYTGTYGSGVYTRTIAVNLPPVISSWYFGSTALACGAATGCVTSGASCGPPAGGQPFKLCGSNFLPGAVIEFDGVAATGCSYVNGSTYTCTATPAHFSGNAVLRLRNSDTRQGTAAYTYSGSARTSALTVAKSGGNALLGWTCPSANCTVSAPARVYRSQNAPFTLNVEQYNGGASNGSNLGSFTNTNALSANTYSSYFWTVE
jgi:hypothetical protein